MELNQHEQEAIQVASPDYWLGYLAAAISGSLRDFDQRDAAGERVFDCDHAMGQVRRAFDVLMISPAAADFLGVFAERQYAGFVVEAATGEAQALRDTWDEADDALTDVESYWYEATAAGQGASDYVAKMEPFRIRQITRQEREEILENGTPTIDREP